MRNGSDDGRTIFALASGAGRAGIAVLRISGTGCAAILTATAGGCPPPRRATLRYLHDASGEILDRALVLWFPAPASYTGEDCAELHVHGGPAVIAGVSAALAALGARPAEPGEFTRRAFLSGQVDLLGAEAVADLIDAETTAQRAQALRQMQGALGSVYTGWAEKLRHMLAWQEAQIDFADQELPAGMEAALLRDLGAVSAEIAAHLDDQGRGELLRSGLVFVVAGPPNVGKSSLINALVGRDLAIVSAQAGTTRDAIEMRLDLDGIPVTLVDTAGLRRAQDEIEAEGIRRTHRHIGAADLVVNLCDATQMAPEASLGTLPGRQLRVANKIDLAPAPAGWRGVSAARGDGLAELRAALAAEATRLVSGAASPPLTRARHRVALQDALGFLQAAAEAPFADLRAEDLRLALGSLGRITGAVGVEDILDDIFGAFCIGK